MLRSVLVLFPLIHCAVAHDLGLHGLMPVHPPNTPELPEITGPFTVDITMRFDDLTTRSYQRGFDFSVANATDDSDYIRFGQFFTTKRAWLAINKGPKNRKSITTLGDEIEEGVVSTWSVGVKADGTMFIKKDGVLLREIRGHVPRNVTRPVKKLGNAKYLHDDNLKGAVLGIKVQDHNRRDPLHELDFLNMPGQMFNRGFTASMYARFNDTSRWHQRVFDMGVAAGDCEVWFGQVENSTKMALEIYNSNTTGDRKRLTTDLGAIVEDEDALWHCGVNSTGYMFIKKNGAELAAEDGGLLMPHCFRKEIRVGHSLFSSHEPLQGYVMGLRIDSHRVS